MRTALVVFCAAAALARPAIADEAMDSRASALLDEALRAMAMTREDLSFRTDYADDPDSFRVSVVDSLLETPLDTEPYVVHLADRLTAARSMAEMVRICATQLDIALAPDAGAPTDRAAPGGETGSGMPVGPDPIDILVAGAHECAREVELAFAGLSDDEREFVAENAAVLLEEDEFDPDKPIDERDREAERDEQLGDELLRIAALVDYESICRAAYALAHAVDDAVPLLQNWSGPSPIRAPGAKSEAWSGDVVGVLDTAVGKVVIGGAGPTEYREPCAIIIDLGGDDTYLASAAGATPDMPVSVVIDLGGDDTYAAGHHSAGGGFMGVGIMVDLEGDDSYEAGSFSEGSGLFGAGLLEDLAGNDTYHGDTCTQGSGAFGLGLLVDEGGNDSYQAALFSQAFGFVEGVGALVERGGNDVYFAGGKYTDEIRYFDHYISLSQGFGFGWRPTASGGIGLLTDTSGNDVYVSDIFGQGASYWFSVGGLVDRSGNDKYVSYQYAQGAATHITVAALVDSEGDDNYVSKGVSQGCGHDLAIGILHDLGGDDNYVCHDLSQGAGNANGIGVIIDDGGDDSYSVRNPENTQGYGNLRRDYGSIGVLIDCGGSDSYSGRGADGTWWIGSDYGIGVDANETEREDAR